MGYWVNVCLNDGDGKGGGLFLSRVKLNLKVFFRGKSGDSGSDVFGGKFVFFSG